RPTGAALTAALQSGEPTAAIRQVQAFLEISPNSPKAMELLGASCSTAQRHEEAAEAYSAAVRLNPSDIGCVAAAAKAFRAAGEPAKAKACCQAYVDAWPTDPRGHLLLGDTLLADDGAAEARREFDEALRLAPDSLDALRRLVRVCIGQGAFGGGIEACEAYLKRHPEDARAWHLLAGPHAAKGGLADAQRCLARALRLDGDLVQARFDLGNIHLRRKDYGRAIEHFEAVAERRPSDARALNNLAWCLAET
ncbi:MAG: tetratricopeptide repeat protein, partial [Planctomycetota bacterium]